jgi:hypothetical protein
VETARTADFTLITRGGVQAKEGNDRTVLTLDDENTMGATTDAVAKVLPSSKLALVVVVGEPVALEMYQSKFGAIMLALEGGQAAGTAFAKVLSGAVNPSGSLPFTMYSENYVREVKMSDMSLRPNQTTGSKGKTYRFYTGLAVWPFGYGLSYTNFTFSWGSNMPSEKIAASTLASGNVTFPITVTNMGLIYGTVAVQLYMSTPDLASAPLQNLIAFDKVAVEASSSVTITLHADAVNGSCSFCVYDDVGQSSIPVGTRYQIFVGNGAGPLGVFPFEITAM